MAIQLRKANTWHEAINLRRNTLDSYFIIEMPITKLDIVLQDSKDGGNFSGDAFWKPSRTYLTTNMGYVQCQKEHIWPIFNRHHGVVYLTETEKNLDVTPIVLSEALCKISTCSVCGPFLFVQDTETNKIKIEQEIRGGSSLHIRHSTLWNLWRDIKWTENNKTILYSSYVQWFPEELVKELVLLSK